MVRHDDGERVLYQLGRLPAGLDFTDEQVCDLLAIGVVTWQRDTGIGEGIAYGA